MHYIHIAAFLVWVLISFFDTASIAHAQGGAAGITLVPAVLETAANPGDTLTETLIITNHNDEEKEFFLVTKDITGVEAGGVPMFAEEGAEVTGFEMTEWIALDRTSVVIPAGGEVQIPLVVTVPNDASPGSHFGGVFASVAAPRLREIGAGVGYEVASIISIRINGDVIDKARIRSFSTSKLIYGEKNVAFEAMVENQGNIMIRPRGPVTITGMFGKPVTFVVNDTLPGYSQGHNVQ
ncbi:MAG: DUF916 domain-containing protein [Candidatus Pacebacteria bacterium]|nr:DUF916 domain-containing protein [Candidatus Paceibacterota bacterium]